MSFYQHSLVYLAAEAERSTPDHLLSSSLPLKNTFVPLFIFDSVKDCTFCNWKHRAARSGIGHNVLLSFAPLQEPHDP